MYEELVKRLRELPHLLSLFHNQEDVVYQAVDAIEELEEKVQVYAETLYAYEHPWISVTERLPEDTHPVLVTYLGYNDKLPKSDMVAMCDDGDWYWYDDESKCKVAITHWMPLPQPPKEDS